MALSCDKQYTISELLNMSVMVRTDGRGVINTVAPDVAVPDTCVSYFDCNKYAPLLGVLRALFVEVSAGCWAIRATEVSVPTTCNSWYICDNSSTGVGQLLQKSISIDADGNPVLIIANDGNDAEGYAVQCGVSEVSQLIRSVFVRIGTDCIGIRGADSAPVGACISMFDCTHQPLGWVNTLQRAMGKNANGCIALFLTNSGATSDCGISLLKAGSFHCSKDYGLVVDPTGGVDLGAIMFTWEQSNGGVIWVAMTSGLGVTHADKNGGTNPTHMRVTMECEGTTVTLTMDTDTLNYYNEVWSLTRWMQYSIDGGGLNTLIDGNVLWLAEGQTITISNPNSAVIDSDYNASYNTYAGPNRTITKGTADNQTLYNEQGSVVLTDIITYPSDVCVVQVQYDINFVPIPIIDGSNYICGSGNSTLLTANYGANTSELYTTYQWNKDGVVIGGATAKTYSATVAGNYTCTITHHGKSLTSSVFAVSVTALPQPKLVFTKVLPADSEYIFNLSETAVYVPSDTALVNIQCIDLGAYSGGYPLGTTFDWGVSGGVLVDDNVDITATSLMEVTVKLPDAGYGGCEADATPLIVDFGSMLAPWYSGVYVHPCSGGLPDPPDAGTYWGALPEDCGGTGIGCSCNDENTAWEIATTPGTYPYNLNPGVGFIEISSSLESTDPGKSLSMYANTKWYKLYDLATDTWITPLHLSAWDGSPVCEVTEAGVYGVRSDFALGGTITVSYGYINFIVPTI